MRKLFAKFTSRRHLSSLVGRVNRLNQHDWDNKQKYFEVGNLCTPDRLQSKMLLTIDKCLSKITKNSVFQLPFVAIQATWQLKTLFLKIFDLCTLIIQVLTFLIAAYPVCYAECNSVIFISLLKFVHMIHVHKNYE